MCQTTDNTRKNVRVARVKIDLGWVAVPRSRPPTTKGFVAPLTEKEKWYVSGEYYYSPRSHEGRACSRFLGYATVISIYFIVTTTVVVRYNLIKSPLRQCHRPPYTKSKTHRSLTANPSKALHPHGPHIILTHTHTHMMRVCA